jgi:hypothetical protein
MEIHEYIYLNNDGIDSLLAQLTDELVLETVIEETNNRTGKAKGGFGFSGILKAMASSDVGLEGELGVQYSQRKNIAFAYEHKLATIYKKLQDEGALFTFDIALNKQSNNCPFKSELLFYTNQRHEQLRECGYLLFEYRSHEINAKLRTNYRQYQSKYIDPYNHSDNYYKNGSNKRVCMNLNIDKLTTSTGNTSHLMTMLRGSGGLISLGVFGYLIKVTPDYFQIKPYAVWM